MHIFIYCNQVHYINTWLNKRNGPTNQPPTALIRQYERPRSAFVKDPNSLPITKHQTYVVLTQVELTWSLQYFTIDSNTPTLLFETASSSSGELISCKKSDSHPCRELLGWNYSVPFEDQRSIITVHLRTVCACVHVFTVSVKRFRSSTSRRCNGNASLWSDITILAAPRWPDG